MNKILDFFKIMSDETRFRIIMILQERELCVCEMCEILQINQPNVSRHLSKLKDLGIVRVNRQGQMFFYYLNIESRIMGEILQYINEYKLNYELIKEDVQRLRKKEEEGRMCQRQN